MDFQTLLLSIYESETPTHALTRLGEALSSADSSLHGLLWVDERGAVRSSYPEGLELPTPLVDEPSDSWAKTILGIDWLPLPLSGTGGHRLVLVSRGGPLVRDPDEWQPVASAFARLVARSHALEEMREKQRALERRAEESEALHVMGLSANRSLDPDEVLHVVTRFARTLLGAHYVTVGTREESQIDTVASIGLRNGTPGDVDPLAERVVAENRPLYVGGEELPVAHFPLHAREGMCAGIGVPLSLYGETFGALVVGYRREYASTPRDTRLALTLAGHAAVAISNARLHRALAERSDALERAYEEVRWASQAKERFFASMSHELRTPLNAILGYQSLLLDGVVGEVPAPIRPFLEKANRATENLLHLVNDVLDLSKIEAGKLDLAMEAVDLREVIQDALSVVEPMAAAKSLRLLRPSLSPIPLETDPDRVRQVLLNLLSNAVKFTVEGEVKISVHQNEAAAPKAGPTEASRWIDIRVSDTGGGIAEEDQERVFQEFEQVTDGGHRGGTGLGLPISRKLARLLGGDLSLESIPGRGSTFTLRLPRQPTV